MEEAPAGLIARPPVHFAGGVHSTRLNRSTDQSRNDTGSGCGAGVEAAQERRKRDREREGKEERERERAWRTGKCGSDGEMARLMRPHDRRHAPERNSRPRRGSRRRETTALGAGGRGRGRGWGGVGVRPATTSALLPRTQQKTKLTVDCLREDGQTACS
ncbi:unnamed protein product [Protopolystoma xenopodis]|uniref:Uncharacterized protein n=1 Tax=Protopolystoma xenopodis TaxID=117903 RepID=A0A3S5B000_9PLAT|nr:unnamed protein product [Protopolystoma xenopodis]